MAIRRAADGVGGRVELPRAPACGSLTGRTVEPRRAGRLWWRVAGIAAVLAAAAFAAWGAFSPRAVSGGNGPLFIGSYGLDGGPGNGKQPMGLIIPISSK